MGETTLISFFHYFILVDTSPVLVLDNGSAFLKVGFSDQALPKEIVSSVVGTPLRYSQDIAGMEYSATPGLVYGDSAMGRAGVLHIGRFYCCLYFGLVIIAIGIGPIFALSVDNRTCYLYYFRL
jgi:hypothetical protein